MIRIKAPRVFADPQRRYLNMEYGNGVPVKRGRLYTEAMHRRVVALVRACEPIEDYTATWGHIEKVQEAMNELRAQAEKEAGK